MLQNLPPARHGLAVVWAGCRNFGGMNKKRIRRVLWYVGGSLVFLVIFWVALFAGTDDYKVKLPVIADVKPFRFADQLGDTVTEQDVQGKVCVVSFFFTTCPGICPRMND